MKDNSNIQLTSNIYPVSVKIDDDKINFLRNPDFMSRVWDRGALIKLFQYVHHVNIEDNRLSGSYTIPGLTEWQIRRIDTPDYCSIGLPGEKQWGIVLRGEVFEEVCKCDKHDCKYFTTCRPEMEGGNGVKKRD
jgi:hypothetical protein